MSNLDKVEEFYREAVPIGSKILIHGIDEEFLADDGNSLEYAKKYKEMIGTTLTVVGHQDQDLKVKRDNDDEVYYVNFLFDRLEILKTDNHNNE